MHEPQPIGPLTPDQFRRIREIFESARDRSASRHRRTRSARRLHLGAAGGITPPLRLGAVPGRTRDRRPVLGRRRCSTWARALPTRPRVRPRAADALLHPLWRAGCRGVRSASGEPPRDRCGSSAFPLVHRGRTRPRPHARCAILFIQHGGTPAARLGGCDRRRRCDIERGVHRMLPARIAVLGFRCPSLTQAPRDRPPSRRDGITVDEWRRLFRLLHGMQLLAPGDSVTNAPVSAGDASTSAFIAAFEKTFGPTPRRLPAA